jgi:CheY-like chemotaxis protein
MPAVACQDAPRRRGTREERRECLEGILRGASVLLAEARARQQESLTAGLTGVISAAERLKEMLESAGADVPRRSSTPASPLAEPLRSLHEKERASAPGAAVARAARGEAAILVVDDNPLNREMLVRRLSQKGYRVEEAEGGAEALAKIATLRFDLVLLDIMMPGLSGTEVLRRLREKHSLSDLPVIMATAKDAAEDVLESLKLGANDYVTKPIDFPIVHARVEVQLAYKRAKDEAQALALDLSATNRRLEEVQRRLMELQQGVTGATQGLGAWTRAMAEGISPLIGVRELAVFQMDEKGIKALTSASLAAPGIAELEDARHSPKERMTRTGVQTIVAVLGPMGELHGGVVVPARISLWADTERQLLESFVRNLGTALDLQKVRAKLAQVEERRAATRQEMLSRGIDVLLVCPACRRCYSQATQKCEDDGILLKTPRLLPYRVEGRYRLLQLIGEGGMGTVFRAHDERLDRDVALKILRTEFFEDGEGLLRFEREARAVAVIDHPGVIRIFDSGDLEDGSAYLVMELVSGVNLKDVLDRDGRGSCRQVAALVRQGVEALEAVHHVGILHRDIKPENFICTKAGAGFQAKLLDFGVAKAMNVDTSVTRAGTVLGTPRYMSPEQVQDKPLDVRSDLYSFAVVAYEALAGTPLVPEAPLPKVMMDVAVRRAAPLSDHLPWLPKDVVRAFARALEKDPEHRPKSPREWAAAFVDVLEKTPDTARGWEFRVSPISGEHAPTVTHGSLPPREP